MRSDVEMIIIHILTELLLTVAMMRERLKINLLYNIYEYIYNIYL